MSVFSWSLISVTPGSVLTAVTTNSDVMIRVTLLPLSDVDGQGEGVRVVLGEER
jgi:hypothetical protein